MHLLLRTALVRCLGALMSVCFSAMQPIGASPAYAQGGGAESGGGVTRGTVTIPRGQVTRRDMERYAEEAEQYDQATFRVEGGTSEDDRLIRRMIGQRPDLAARYINRIRPGDGSRSVSRERKIEIIDNLLEGLIVDHAAAQQFGNEGLADDIWRTVTSLRMRKSELERAIEYAGQEDERNADLERRRAERLAREQERREAREAREREAREREAREREAREREDRDRARTPGYDFGREWLENIERFLRNIFVNPGTVLSGVLALLRP